MEFTTTKPPYECNVEVDMNWLNSSANQTEALPFSADAYEQGFDDYVPDGPAFVERFNQAGKTAKSCLIGVVVLASVIFGGSLMIAERSGELDDIRRDTLGNASRALPVLALGATAGFLLWRRD